MTPLHGNSKEDIAPTDFTKQFSQMAKETAHSSLSSLPHGATAILPHHIHFTPLPWAIGSNMKVACPPSAL